MNKVVIAFAALAAVAGCTPTQTANVAEPAAAADTAIVAEPIAAADTAIVAEPVTEKYAAIEVEPAVEPVVDAVENVSGRTVLAYCSEIQPDAMQYYPACAGQGAELLASVQDQVLCIHLLPERVLMYAICLDPGTPVIAMAPPPELGDFEIYANSDGTLGELGYGASQSQLSSIDGTRTATQTSGGNTVSVSTGSTHPGLPNRSDINLPRID